MTTVMVAMVMMTMFMVTMVMTINGDDENCNDDNRDDDNSDYVQYRLLKINSPLSRDCVAKMVRPRWVELAWVFTLIFMIIIGIAILLMIIINDQQSS